MTDSSTAIGPGVTSASQSSPELASDDFRFTLAATYLDDAIHNRHINFV
jgi:hypothetical protein